jgi:hypothetical protein
MKILYNVMYINHYEELCAWIYRSFVILNYWLLPLFVGFYVSALSCYYFHSHT